jgi:O-antigen/teichoic acid export membrane protein
VDLVCAVVGVTAVWLTARAGGGLVGLVAVGGCMTLFNSLIFFGIAIAHREWRPAWSLFSVATARSLASFSLATWTISLMNVLLRCDQAVIGLFGALGQVAMYAPGTRVQTLVLQATGQVLGPLVPVIAGADAKTDPAQRRNHLAAVYLVSQRWSALLTVPVAIPVLIHPEPLLHLLTGLVVISPTMKLCAQLLVAQVLVVRLCADPAKQLLLLSGRHWPLAMVTGTEVIVGLGGGAWLVWWMATPVALAGSLAVVSAGVGLLVAIPMACVQTGIDLPLALRALVRPLLGALAAPVLVGLWWWWRPAGVDLLALMLEGLTVVVAALPGWWLVGLDATQRAKVRAVLARFH